MSQLIPNRLHKRGDIIFSQGDAANGLMYFICYGKVEVVRHENGSDRVLALLSEGDIFGEMALISKKPRNATIRVVEDCGFFTLNYANFTHKVDQLDPLMRGMFRVFTLTIQDFLSKTPPFTVEEQESVGKKTVSVEGFSDLRHAANDAPSLVSGATVKLNY